MTKKQSVCKKIVLVEVTGGVAEFIKVPSDVKVYLVDWGCRESGCCAFCGGELSVLDRLEDDAMHSHCREEYEAISK